MPGERREGRFAVSVAKDYLTFSAAHFLTIPDHKCESLHGHNYALTIEVEGAVDSVTGFVVDFAVLKRILRPVLDQLDHRVLIAARCPRIALREEGGSTIVDYRGPKRFVLPTNNVVLVPVTDTSAELLAEHLAQRVLEGLEQARVEVTRLRVELEESPGQAGTFVIER